MTRALSFLKRRKENNPMKNPLSLKQVIRKVINFIKKIVFWSCILCILYIILNLSYCQYKKYQFNQPPIGRDYRSLSIHPNGQEILFIECAEALSTACGVLRYHLDKHELKRYVLPEGYVYPNASFSPKGNYIVLRRYPLAKKYQGNIIAAKEASEILVIKEDDQTLQVLPLPPGHKTDPIMSNNEDKIAYWTMTPHESDHEIKMGYETHIVHQSEEVFDIWEFDLASQQNVLFAGDFRFSSIRGIQYMLGDHTLLVGAGKPGNNYLHQEKISDEDYPHKYNFSKTYLVPRHSKILPAPLFTEIYGASPVSIDKQENLYLIGGDLTDKYHTFRIFKASKNRLIQNWLMPKTFSRIGGNSLRLNVQGDRLILIYRLPDDDTNFGKYSTAMGQFDITSNTWQDILIPPLNQASLINVTIQ